MKLRDGDNAKPHTKAYQNNTPSGFCHYIKCFDDSVFARAPVLYTMQKPVEVVAHVFVESIEKKIKVIYTEHKNKNQEAT